MNSTLKKYLEQPITYGMVKAICYFLTVKNQDTKQHYLNSITEIFKDPSLDKSTVYHTKTEPLVAIVDNNSMWRMQYIPPFHIFPLLPNSHIFIHENKSQPWRIFNELDQNILKDDIMTLVNLFIEHCGLKIIDQRDELGDILITKIIKNPTRNQINIELAQFLIHQSTIDLKGERHVGNTLLTLALIMNYLPIVESLIEKDKKFINLPNDNGDYPLFLAINLNNVEIIQKFVTNGVNMNIKDKWGRKPVEVAKAAQQHIKTPDEADKMSKIIDILSTEERKERLFNKLFQHAIYGVNTCVNFIIYVLLIVPNFCINVHSTITMIL